MEHPTESISGIRRRLERESLRELQASQDDMLRQLMPIIDDLDRTLADARTRHGSDEALLRGVEMIRGELHKLLTRFDLTPIDAVGCDFDPKVHEAVGLVMLDDPEEDGVVVDQWQCGYTRGGAVVRPARVSVARFVG